MCDFETEFANIAAVLFNGSENDWWSLTIGKHQFYHFLFF